MPKRFGKYTLIRKLAVGGMAELFLAIQRSMAGFEKLIVIKRVLPQLAQDKEFAEMLLDEARIAATLNHPNVAHIYDVGVWEEQYFIAMEHVHGEDLRAIVRQMKKKEVTSFPLEHALAIVLGCCAGLAYAHEKRDLDGEPLNIIHRDVSPQNILVTFSGDVKLVDFGIAKAGRSTMEETKSGKLKGKIPYMSPEQAQGEPLDQRSDIFSLGVILYELCTGRRLFKGGSEFDTMKLIVEGTYPRPRSINPNLPARLEEIIMRALAKDRAYRYQSAREMQGDLEGFIRAERLAVSPLSLGEWMQSLFDEKLAQQKKMLQEGRQLAEVIAAQVAEEESSLGSHVRSRRASKVPWVLLLLVLLAAGGAATWLLTRPAPQTGPQKGPGVIAVTSEPPGAAIWLDGDRIPQRTPAEITELPVGATYTLKLTSDGFAPHVQRVELTDQEQRASVEATLERPSAADFGVINVRTVPAGATVLLNGTDTGLETPATVPEIEPGVEHTLTLSLGGYHSKTVPLTMRAGQAEDLTFELEALPLASNESILRIYTQPEEARVEFDGEWYEAGSPYEFRVMAGRYTVDVAKGGYRNERERVRLPGGEVTELEITLRPDRRRPVAAGGGGGGGGETTAAASGPGQLTFDARPWCNVAIDGQAVGQTPIVNRSLPSGRHRITCTNPELGKTENITVDIQPGQTTRRRIDLQ